MLKGQTHELNIDFDPQMMVKAVVWLSQQVKRPILRLREEDYENNGLASLLRQEGDPFKINIKVFSRLRDTEAGGKSSAAQKKTEYAYPQKSRECAFFLRKNVVRHRIR